jgi:hypothetical protein
MKMIHVILYSAAWSAVAGVVLGAFPGSRIASGVGGAIFAFAQLSAAGAHLFGSKGFSGGCIGGALLGFILGIIKPIGSAGAILPTAIAGAIAGPICALFIILILKLLRLNK